MVEKTSSQSHSSMMLKQVSGHAKPAAKKLQPILDTWKSLNMDAQMSQKAVDMRKKTQDYMRSIQQKLVEYNNTTEFPHWVRDEIQSLGVNGLQIKGYGSPEVNTLEAGAICYEMAKIDGSVATFFLVHNAIGMSVIDALGDQEQKDRMLTPAMKMEKICCFGLTEPLNGSDATGLKTTATKVEGGYLLNGQKRWIGNATFADYIVVWARNASQNNKIQAFVVEKGSKGLKTSKIENKFSLRVVQNADIELKDCFVPDNNKLTHSHDFATGTNRILEASRIVVAWMACGLQAGAYEAALQYCLKRKQFGRPIAKFQLIQERLSRMLANVEFSITLLARVSQLFDEGKASIGMIGRAKANVTRLGRETVALGREICGGNGIIIDNHVMKQFLDMEAMYTYEGTYDVNSLVSARELTGGLSAIK